MPSSPSPTNRRHRIGIDARMYRKATGGIGRYTRELLHHLLPLDPHNEYVIFLTEADLNEWDIDLPNVTPHVVTALHYTSQEQTSFARELYKQKLDLVHFLSFNHPMLYRKPFVVTLHDLTMFLFPAHGQRRTHPIKRLGFNAIFRRAMHAAKKVIAISEYSAFDAEKNWSVMSLIKRKR
jgi:glycosyltransferase involved in cell wall biosynthesis